MLSVLTREVNTVLILKCLATCLNQCQKGRHKNPNMNTHKRSVLPRALRSQKLVCNGRSLPTTGLTVLSIGVMRIEIRLTLD